MNNKSAETLKCRWVTKLYPLPHVGGKQQTADRESASVTVSPERLVSMQGAWANALEAYRVAPADAYPVFDLLVAAYTAPERHYHNLEHLAEMFRVVGRLSARVEQPAALHLAVWFHDAVYDSRAKDNEKRSGELAADLLGPIGVPASAIDRIVQMIWATQHTVGAVPPAARDTRVLLDADLAILGASEHRYARYAADIRREYAWVPDPDYRTGRARVLQHFLAAPRIYLTDMMFEEGEERARDNLRGELAMLV
jgi:predicted metal-dependent HD superfamily phosphohydrolase